MSVVPPRWACSLALILDLAIALLWRKRVGVVAGLHDVAAMDQPLEECRGHLGVGEDAGPLGEGEVGSDHHAGVLVELGEQVKEQGPARLTEGQVAELIEDDQTNGEQSRSPACSRPCNRGS